MYRFFLKMRLDEEEAIQLSHYIEDMASINTTARLEAKIDAQNTKFNLLLWMIGVGLALIIVSNLVVGGGV